MTVDGSGSINLTELPLHLCESSTHLSSLLIRQSLQRPLVDRSRGRKTKVGGRFFDVNCKQFELVGILNSRGGSIVDTHRSLGQTMIFFQFGVHEEERFAEFLRTILQCLLEQISGTFELFAAISLDEFGEVDVPDLKRDGEVEQLNTTLVDLE